MDIKLQLTKQEQQWLEQIADYHHLPVEAALRMLIKEQHEQLSMDLAYERFPQSDAVEDIEADNREARKAALKRSLIERALQDYCND